MIQSDAIRLAIREKLTDNTSLKTPAGAEFLVETVSPTQIVFRIGTKQTRAAVHLDCIEDLVKEFRFLPPGGWMRIGATTGQPKVGTLGAIVKAHTQGGSSASQFAAVLKYVGVAEITKSRPIRFRLSV